MQSLDRKLWYDPSLICRPSKKITYTICPATILYAVPLYISFLTSGHFPPHINHGGPKLLNGAAQHFRIIITVQFSEDLLVTKCATGVSAESNESFLQSLMSWATKMLTKLG